MIASVLMIASILAQTYANNNKIKVKFNLACVKMTVNFSKEQIKQNVTFDKLDLMIDQWTVELQENQNVFSLQYEELNKLMFGICSCRDKVSHHFKKTSLIILFAL